MALTTHPFHPVTGQLLPSHRDAYLRGDLSGKNNELVDAYLKANPEQGGEAFQRFHTLQQNGHSVRPVGWLQHQFDLIRTEPARFRQRAATVGVVAMLLSGAVFASSNLPTSDSAAGIELGTGEMAAGEVAAAARMTTVTGRILDENGRPLIGATILDKNTGRGASTDANGNYTLAVPANRASRLQYGYGGYGDEEFTLTGRTVENVTLLPRADAKKLKRHWWQF